MALCIFSIDYNTDGYTMVDNAFISHYLPYAGESALKVYLLGINLCQNPQGQDNTLDNMCISLDMTAEDVIRAFEHWETRGLVSIASRSPLTVRFNSPRAAFAPNRKFNKDKYSDFLENLQLLFPDRTLSSNELYQYLTLIEDNNIEPDAVLLIAKYCVDLKGVSIRYAYIISVAKNWIEEGCHNVADVEDRLKESEAASENIRAIFKALKKISKPDIEDRQYYLKWTKNWGYSDECIKLAASSVKRGGMEKLDAVLDEYFKQSIFTVQDIKEYAKRREQMYNVSVQVNKILGLYYQSLDFIVESYIHPWLQKGYEGDGLVMIAKYCFMNSIRQLEGMNKVVNSFYEEGIITENSINEHLHGLMKNDSIISEIIAVTGSTRNVTENDRKFYLTWSITWNFSDELILEAAKIAEGRAYAFTYINKVLSKWKEEGVKSTVDFNKQTTSAGIKLDKEYKIAEIRNILMGDEEYRRLEQEKKKLALDMSRYLSRGENMPSEMETRYKQILNDLDARINALGYAPSDLKK
ncbi:MAG: DnaD domain protein [Clostridia bacterium]|nr:DnaD domain protein [Clostridia bacterium]